MVQHGVPAGQRYWALRLAAAVAAAAVAAADLQEQEALPLHEE